MINNIIVHTKESCQVCERVKRMLTSYGAKYDIENNALDLISLPRTYSAPIITYCENDENKWVTGMDNAFMQKVKEQYATD